MSNRWMEYECPQCGIDYDVEPPPKPGDAPHVCPCGFTLTPEVLQAAQFYDDEKDPRLVANPFAA